MLRTHALSALQNLVLLVPLVLSGGFLRPEPWLQVLAGYALLCGLSVLHAEFLKRRGRLRIAPLAGLLYGMLLGASLVLDPAFALIALAYSGLALFNGMLGRRVVVIDVLVISASVVLKALAGVLLVDGQASSWAFIFLFLASCTVALGQRRNELRHQGALLRQVLEEYTPKLLDQMLAVVTSSTLVAYSVYALAERDQTVGDWMVYSAILVDFGLFRYLYLVYHKDMSCGAELAVARDPQLVGSFALWLGLSYLIHL